MQRHCNRYENRVKAQSSAPESAARSRQLGTGDVVEARNAEPAGAGHLLLARLTRTAIKVCISRAAPVVTRPGRSEGRTVSACRWPAQHPRAVGPGWLGAIALQGPGNSPEAGVVTAPTTGRLARPGRYRP